MTRLFFLLLATVFASAALANPACYELQTYTAKPGQLDVLHDVLCSGVLAKDGAEVLAVLVPAGENPVRKLIYLLSHRSIDAAKQSFAAFRADPDWFATKEASEKKAGGSLTEKDGGVLSEFFVGAEYSPLRRG